MSWLFPCLTVEEEQPRRRFDKSMIGDPADFRHTGHIGSGDTSQALSTVKTQMGSKGGDPEGSTPEASAGPSTSPAVAGAIDLSEAQAKFGNTSTEEPPAPAPAPGNDDATPPTVAAAMPEAEAEVAEPAAPSEDQPS
eukprot:m.34612 g.34612  ORF g.34612 m.34612 type:complete len:138 (+) comp12325_c0_seq1:310-723(+)